MKEILEHCAEDKENFSKQLSRRSLGCIMKDVFRDKVRLVQRGPRGSIQRAYLNIQRIKKKQEEIDVLPGSSSIFSVLPTINVPNGWHYIKDGTDQVSFIRYESWEFSQQRGITELRVKQTSPQEITLQAKAHGCSVDLKTGLGLEEILSKLPMERQISLATQFIENSHICLGFQLSDCDSVMTMLPHVTGVFQSIAEGEGLIECKKVFAQNCRVLTGPSKICHNCSHLQTVDANRRKRKANQAIVHPACNKRFMTRHDVECQLKREQMARRNAEKREMYWREKFDNEAIVVEDEDQQDLLKMSGAIEGNIPEEMQCLWEQQKKIVSTKSKNGYRWHPK